ncbi:hypothetical protein ANCCEY_15315 [Ancylostoma ceylanicum]|uniref:Collagen triple helix repeat protein n=1 Tax=Ancylostoma ceylanicum TaxID=53326 RepID=A0A0D6L510_9BILA|nr:hypothetical protein ANCCEY_15315 [Ancylostoma ceylanicum]
MLAKKNDAGENECTRLHCPPGQAGKEGPSGNDGEPGAPGKPGAPGRDGEDIELNAQVNEIENRGDREDCQAKIYINNGIENRTCLVLFALLDLKAQEEPKENVE